ncbi:MAG: hypothetical protein QW815_00075 [Nitrososphaerota archaeon]
MLKRKGNISPITDNVQTLRELRRGVICSLLLTILLCIYVTFLSMDYRIELELGGSLNPYIGRYAVLIVQENPPEIYIGDLVTVVCAGDTGIITIRKMVWEVSCYVVDVENELGADYIRLVSPTRDYGWFPVSSVRAKVVKILFRGFIETPKDTIIFPPEKVLERR